MTEPPTIILTLPCPPSANRIWRKAPGFKRPLLSQEYRSWIASAGWLAKMQLAGTPTILGSFNAHVTVPQKSRRDRDNWTKPIFDLCQRIGAVRNDSGLREYSVTAEARDNCRVALWDIGGPEIKETRSRKVAAMKPRPTAAQIKRSHRWNVARGLEK